MSIPPTADCFLDFGNPSSFTNGGTAITDLSGNGKNWTLDNTSYTFDASVGAVLLPTGLQAQGNNTQYAYGTGAFSILTWVKLINYGGSSNICLLGPDGGGTRLFYFLDPPAQSILDNGGSAIGQSPITYDNEWHLVASTRPSNGLVQDQKVYVDGVLIPNTIFYNPSTALNQGSGGYAILHSGFNPQPLNIATFKIYLAELDSTDLTAIYNAEKTRFFPVPTPVLTLELDATNASSYPGTGSTWFDLTANNNDLTLYGNTTWANIDSVKSFDFDGTNSYAYNASVSVGATNNFTIDSWFKINGTQTNQFIHCLGNPGANNYPLIGYNFTSYFSGVFGEMGGGTAGTEIIASPVIDTWYNVTIAADGTDVKYYVDGALQSTVSQGSGSIPTSSIELTIGNHAPGIYSFWLDGNVGYYAVYDGAIGSTQISTNYSTNLPKFTPIPPVPEKSNGRSYQQGFNG